MSYDELLAQVYAALPQLKGQLHAPRVVYVQSQGKVYITFESNVLVEEASFLKLEALLRRVFPQKPLALRVVSPGLKDDFLENISAYKQVLTDFLRRNYPASASWMSQIDWRCDGKRITLILEDDNINGYLSFRNIPGVRVLAASELNTYDFIDNKALVVTSAVLDRIEEVLA